MSHQLFNFQRFAVVMEYEEKPILPSPFTVISHLHYLCKYLYRSCKGNNKRFESGLKLFLSKFDMERLYDFEEEAVERMMRSKEDERQQNMANRVKNLVDVSEELRTKLFDLERWETISQEMSQSLDFRLQRLEDVAEQTSSQLSVIHRFLASTMNMPVDEQSLRHSQQEIRISRQGEFTFRPDALGNHVFMFASCSFNVYTTGPQQPVC